MDKRRELMKKMSILLQEVDKAKLRVSAEKVNYLDRYKDGIERVMRKLQNDTLSESKGGLIGSMRGISEYDDLASIKELYDAAVDVDLFYSEECKEW